MKKEEIFAALAVFSIVYLAFSFVMLTLNFVEWSMLVRGLFVTVLLALAICVAIPDNDKIDKTDKT